MSDPLSDKGGIIHEAPSDDYLQLRIIYIMLNYRNRSEVAQQIISALSSNDWYRPVVLALSSAIANHPGPMRANIPLIGAEFGIGSPLKYRTNESGDILRGTQRIIGL